MSGIYGKDSPENFIKGALCGGSGKSNEIVDESIGRGQTIKRAFAMDNVDLVMPIETSLKDEGGFKGSTTNLRHSLVGASSVDGETGAA